jgi:hypothetical protein
VGVWALLSQKELFMEMLPFKFAKILAGCLTGLIPLLHRCYHRHFRHHFIRHRRHFLMTQAKVNFQMMAIVPKDLLTQMD